MISKQKCLFYFVGETPYKDLKEAQKADLIKMMPDSWMELKCDKEATADWLISNAGAIIDTLTTTPTSRLRARKAHGGTKKHRTKLQPANLESK